MGVDGRLARIRAALRALADHAHKPDDTEQVVDVLMRDEYLADVAPARTGLLEPRKNQVTAAGVDE